MYVVCIHSIIVSMDFSSSSAVKESTCSARDLGMILGLRRSTGEGNGYPLQYSGLKNSMHCIAHGVTKNRTWLSDLHFHFHQFSGSVMSNSANPWTAACKTSLSITNSQNLPKLMFIKSVMSPNHLSFCHPFFSCLQSFPASGSFPKS